MPDVDELGEGDPVQVARTNAELKLRAVEAGTAIAVDTLVSLDDTIYGKPRDEAHAREMLTALSGREHRVVSGIALRHDGETQVAHETTLVRFRDAAELLDWYLASGEWRERAGGYAIQGRGAALVDGIVGDYFNVVGLPVTRLLDLWPGVVRWAR